MLERADAFEHACAASFYQVDTCGDGITGRAFRSVLVARLEQCPFSNAAKVRFFIRATAQPRKSRQAIGKLIEANGGLTIRLAGMQRTCRAQRESAECQEVRSRLEAFSAGRLKVDAVVAAPCDAAEIGP